MFALRRASLRTRQSTNARWKNIKSRLYDTKQRRWFTGPWEEPESSFGPSDPFCFSVSSISSPRFVNQLTAKVLHCWRRINEAWTVTDRLTGLPVAPTHPEHMAEEHTSVVQSDRVAVWAPKSREGLAHAAACSLRNAWCVLQRKEPVYVMSKSEHYSLEKVVSRPCSLHCICTCACNVNGRHDSHSTGFLCVSHDYLHSLV